VGTVVVDWSAGNTGNGIAGLIAKAIITAVNSATADYVKHAHTANRRIINTLPAGPYNEMYMKDQGVQLIDQTPGK
jgi:hypothetical protein